MNNPVEKAIKVLGTQNNLASVCGVSQNAVSKWLKGYNRVTLEKALIIEKATNKEVKAEDFNPDYAILLNRT